MIHTAFELQLPESPMEGDLILGRSVQQFLDMDYIEGLNRALRFEAGDKPPIYNAAGRNYIVPLPKPFGPYDAIQVAGGGHAERGVRSTYETDDSIVAVAADRPKIITPPSGAAELFRSGTTYYENGEFVERENVSPLGSYTHEGAMRKMRHTREAEEVLAAGDTPVYTPHVIGHFEYEMPDQHGKPQTAVLMLVPDMGFRFGNLLNVPYAQALHIKPDELGLNFGKAVLRYYDLKLIQPLRSIGEGLAAVHEAGKVHGQPHAGNMGTIDMGGGAIIPYIADWDTMTTPSPEDMRRSQAMDVLMAVTHASGHLLRMESMRAINTDERIELFSKTVLSLLTGYDRYSTLGINKITYDDIAGMTGSGTSRHEVLDTIESWINP